MIGRTLSHYTITERLGGGGMGEVYRAEDASLGRQIALKVLPPELREDADRLARFRQEAEALAALDHPAIVTIHSIENVEGIHFLTMQLIEGQSLGDILPPEGMSIEEILEIAIPLTEALASAHEKGVIHRDLKPANIMRTPDGRVKVLDFGLAELRHKNPVDEASDTEPIEGSTLGTLPYMPPEQLEGLPLDPTADIFSVGVILHEMATGRRPFRGETQVAVITSILAHTPLPVDIVRPDLPAALGKIIQNCLEKQAADRHQSALELRNDLKELRRKLAGEEPELTESDMAAALAPPGLDGRSPLFIPLVSLLMAVMVTIFFWSLVSRGSVRTGEPTVAILPFQSVGAAEDQAFTDGLVEEITAQLAGARGLRVISAYSAREAGKLANTDTEASGAAGSSAQAMGMKLGADYVVTGNVRWGPRDETPRAVRINPTLLRVEDEGLLWAESYERDLSTVVAGQAEIARSLARYLDAALLSRTGPQAPTPPTENPEAYEAFLASFSVDAAALCPGLDGTVQNLRRAVELDPQFARAWARLARQLSQRRTFCLDESPETLQEIENALAWSTELAPDDFYTALARAQFAMRVESDYGGALAILDSFPGKVDRDSELLTWKGSLLRRLGHWDEAREAFTRAFEIDPLNAMLAERLASTLLYMRDYAAAIEMYDTAERLAARPHLPQRKAATYWLWKGDTWSSGTVLAKVPEIERNPDIVGARFWQKLFEERPEDAIDVIARGSDWIPYDTDYAPKALYVAFARDAAGDERASEAYEEARAALEERIARSAAPDPRLLRALSLAYAGLGRKEEAVHTATQAVETTPAEEDPLFGSAELVNLALVYARIGELHLALRTLDQVLGMPALISVELIQLDPRWEAVAQHRDFRRLKRKYG